MGKLTIQSAASKIEQAKNKVLYALFWFVNSSHIDAAAISNLKDGKIPKAIEIWEKTIKTSSISPKNFTSASNLSTLQLGITTYNGSFSPGTFIDSIELKGKLLTSEVFNSFIYTVTGDRVSFKQDHILKMFADEILILVKPYLDKKNGITTSQLIKAFNTYPNEIKLYVSGKFTDRPLSNIESQIERTKQKREHKPGDAEEYGDVLYKNTEENLVFLKGIWGSGNLQYQMIANKLANEILQCSIDFFNYYGSDGETEFDPFEDAIRIANFAKSIGPTGQVKNRIEETSETLDKLRFRDAHQAIAFIDQVISVYEQVEKENSGFYYLPNQRRTVVNEAKIFELARPILDNKIIEIIAKSGNDILIYQFYNSINKLLPKLSYVLSEYFKNRKEILISNLPMHNKIRRQLEQEKLEKELREAEAELRSIQSRTYFKSELDAANYEMARVQQWQFMRSQSDRLRQISEQQARINELSKRAEHEKSEKLKAQQQIILYLKAKLKEYSL